MIPVNSERIVKIDAAEFSYSQDRMQVVGEVFGDQSLVEFFDASPLRGLMAAKIPNPFFNRVLISTLPSAAEVEAMLDRFAAKQVTPMVEVSPGALDRDVAKVLAARGLVQTGFHPVFVRPLDELKHEPSNLHVHVVSSPTEVAVFQDLYVRGWETAEGFAPTMKRYIEKWLGLKGWHLMLAHHNGKPIGCAVLYVKGRLAYLADAATPKELRGHGAQTALLAARLELAQSLGCDSVFSRADFGSVSHKNMEKIGLAMSYTRAVWTVSS